MPYWSPTTRSRVGEMSQIAVTSYISGMDVSTGRWITWATSPRPMTPIRSLVNLGHLSRRFVRRRGGSALGGPRDEAAGQGTLEKEEEDQDRQGRQDACGHDVAPLGCELLDEAVHPEAQGEVLVGGD